MDIYKIIAIAIITSILCIYLKSFNSDFFVPVLITGGTLILFFSLEYLSRTFDIFYQFATYTGISTDILQLIIKIIIIAYLIEFACSMIDDFGFSSIADKLSFAGKIVLFSMSIPIFNGLLQVILALLK